MKTGDIVRLKVNQDLVSGVTLRAGTVFRVDDLHTSPAGNRRANLVHPRTGELQASSVEIGRLELMKDPT